MDFYSQFLLLASKVLGGKEMCVVSFDGWQFLPCIVDIDGQKNLKDGVEVRF